MVFGRTNLPTTGLPIAHKPYPVPFKHQKFANEEKELLDNAGCIYKSLSQWASPVITEPKKPDPLNPPKQQLCLVLDYQLLYKSINTTNGNSAISSYPLPKIMDLLARLQKCTYFLFLRPLVRLPPYLFNTLSKAETCFCHNKWLMTLEV